MQLHQIPMYKAWDVVGYDYGAETFCNGICVLAAMGELTTKEALEAENLPAALAKFGASTVEDALGLIAVRRAIDRHTERSYDQSAFPKVIFASAEYEYCPYCAGCGGVLDSFDAADYATEDDNETEPEDTDTTDGSVTGS